MTLTTVTVRRPATTVWSILDSFLIDLASLQNKICSESPSLSKHLYQKLVDLMCKGDTRALDEIDFVKPYYPFILITYYILFHRHNLEAAEAVFKRLKKAYEEHPYTFDLDEKCSLKVLEEVIKDFTVLKKQPSKEYKGRLNTRLRETALKIEKIECYPGGWGNAFKMLVISHLDPEKGMQILEEMPTLLSIQSMVIDEDVLEGYNLIVYEASPSTLEFLRGVSNAVYNTLFNKFKDLRAKENEKNDLERKVERIQEFISLQKNITSVLRALLILLMHLSLPVAVVMMYYKIIGTLMSWLISLLATIPYFLDLCYLYYKRRLNKVKKEIEGFIENEILKEMYETIWPNG
jgi:hypothetical protein